MRKEVEITELIEQYLSGSMTGEEKERFEQRLQEEPELQEKVRAERQVLEIIEEASFLDLRDSLNEIHLSAGAKGGRLPGRGWMAGGLLALLIFGIIIVILTRNNNPEAALVVQPNEEVNISIDTIAEKPLLVVDSIDSGIKLQKKNQEKPASQITVAKVSDDAVSPSSLKDHPIDSSGMPGQTAAYVIKELQKDTSKTTVVSRREIKNTAPVEKFTVIDSCAEVRIEAEVLTEASCEGNPTGTLQIIKESLTGGTSPYRVSINNEKSYQSLLHFEALYSGMYMVWIKDNKGCKTKLGNYRIDSKDCSYSYRFAPDKFEEWKIPSRERGGRIQIFNEVGNIVWEEELLEGMDYFWQGRSLTGKSLPMGIYPFVIEFRNGESIVGTVTVLR